MSVDLRLRVSRSDGELKAINREFLVCADIFVA